ncbi:kinase-like domain-containing protein [Favolaschia claudopus]|uniref:Kinase-like domain-containing protein n=1 Tax=Favolaschia claudopus TaxID=2862362 RepID=A0AAW0B8B9_9AGAR
MRCQYSTGRLLGEGTYATIKEAFNVDTGETYACKIINKNLVEGREYMVRNEIGILNRLSNGHPNIVTLHDYFESSNNLYLCFDLCTGGDLFQRISSKGTYSEAAAAAVVRTIVDALQYIHASGIVHGDLKPENVLFHTEDDDADIRIADFGLSRLVGEKARQLTTKTGTHAYMAPETFGEEGHGKPVDIWAVGVITFYMLAGHAPFQRSSPREEEQAILARDVPFEPEEWVNLSSAAREFVEACLVLDPLGRPTVDELLNHKWLASYGLDSFHTRGDNSADLTPRVRDALNKQLDSHGAGNEQTSQSRELERMREHENQTPRPIHKSDPN